MGVCIFGDIPAHSVPDLGVLAMKMTEEINDTVLLAEILNSLVCEKNEIIWLLPFSEEMHEEIVRELVGFYPVSNN